MKKSILVVVLVVLVCKLSAQNADYYQQMGQTMQKMATSQSEQDYQSLTNQFEMIANVETKEWLPLYYAAQSTILMVHSGVEKEKIDSYLDHAQTLIDKALKINADESELYVLQGFLHQARIGVNPMVRGMKYVQLADKSFAKAKELNPENPRIYYLSAMSVLNTPDMFGGGKKNALPLFILAKEKFENFKPVSALSPNWGQMSNETMVETCQK